MNLVIVESPAKAKTINKYLGKDYVVIASFGHVRDLPSKNGSVDPDDKFAMKWETSTQSKPHIKRIIDETKSSDAVYLATDPDREGEAISWHIIEELNRKNLLKNKTVQRVVFNEITKTAVKKAFENPRELNQELVDAYLARRALDYLVGFSISPVLWRKMPGSKSAGRVQSVALRLICDRENEIEEFNSKEYWTIESEFKHDGKQFPAKLTHFGGAKLSKFDIKSESEAQHIEQQLKQYSSHNVIDVTQKLVQRKPAPPFITSTLQQEASRKLGMGATATMRTAQKLYEGVPIDGETTGLITYMRTDGVTLSNDAIFSIRGYIESKYGTDYCPKSPRMYKSKAKNAQEAHEAIRPTDIKRTPAQMAKILDKAQLQLYTLIWNRTVACQMENARLQQTGVDISPAKGVIYHATGSVVEFDGFMKVYQISTDDKDDEQSNLLPAMAKNDNADLTKLLPEQHFTQPPPRYAEASLVKKLEELGIGRPSTYASILQVLQDREYVELEKKRFVPQDRGRLVTAFLLNYFKQYIEYDFTANLEEQLDDISGGKQDWIDVLNDFWHPFSKTIDGTKPLTITEVIDTLDEDLGKHFFPDEKLRICPLDGGRLGLKFARTGGFIGCSNYPDCKFTLPLQVVTEEILQEKAKGGEDNVIGQHPELGFDMLVKTGPYGDYIELVDGNEKPKRVSIPKPYTKSEVDLDMALKLMELPRYVGDINDKKAYLGIGRFGPYIRISQQYVSLPKGMKILDVTNDQAVDIGTEGLKNKKAPEGKKIGDDPDTKKPVMLMDGKYGPYLKMGRTNASVPKDMETDSIDITTAMKIINDYIAKKKKKKKA